MHLGMRAEALKACMSQNPHAVKVKEEASRLRKRLAAAKKDAAEQEAKAKEQADLLAKLQANLDNITAGAAPQVQGLGSGAPHDKFKTYWVTASSHKCVVRTHTCCHPARSPGGAGGAGARGGGRGRAAPDRRAAG